MFKRLFGLSVLTVWLMAFGLFRTSSAQTTSEQSERISVASALDASAKPESRFNNEDVRDLNFRVKPATHHGFRVGPLEFTEHPVEPWLPAVPYFLQSNKKTVDVHWKK